MIICTNITSPLGMTTQENYLAVKAGRRGLSYYEHWKGLPFPIEASLFSEAQWKEITKTGQTRFESLVISSVTEALKGTDIDLSKTIFILSSTKGDIENLDQDIEVEPLGNIAEKICHYIGISNNPIVVCNACISGLSALILGQRLINEGIYENAIICGADIQSRFIVSGFQSLKALSTEPCQPFDIERLGLNLGEAAATIILSTSKDYKDLAQQESIQGWNIVAGATRNDAYHISTPHPKGSGAILVLNAIKENMDEASIATIGVHGTATMYNDQMESKAIEAVGLNDIPISALKGYYGHTMGAAGLLETILMMEALDEGIILPSLGYQEIGVSGRVKISNARINTDKRAFIKMLSGFGGNNSAVAISKFSITGYKKQSLNTKIQKSVKLSSPDNLTELYKQEVGNYPKFYKMDILSRLAFIATERLLAGEDKEGGDSTAFILFNKTSSIVADRHYEKSIHDKDVFFPSPSAFVYTLPNIALGEIAIRHNIQGETSFYILSEKDENLMKAVVHASFADIHTKKVIAGWIECPTETDFECELYEIIKQK